MSRFPKLRFACGTRVLGTIISPPTDFSKPVLVLSDLPETELIPGQEDLLEKIRQDNRNFTAANHRYWAIRDSDFYGEPARPDNGLRYQPVNPVGVVITPKFLNGTIFDGQMGFPATLVRYRHDLVTYTCGCVGFDAMYAEYILDPVWQRYADTPQLYTT